MLYSGNDTSRTKNCDTTGKFNYAYIHIHVYRGVAQEYEITRYSRNCHILGQAWMIMVATCCVIGFSNHNKGISFHSIPAVIKHQGPRTEELSAKHRRVWIAKINRKDWVPTKNSFVCSVHFISKLAIYIPECITAQKPFSYSFIIM